MSGGGLHEPTNNSSGFKMPEADSSTKHPASKLGEYTVIQDIAEGTFGKVKMATHVVTGHKVAMKFISKAMIHQSKTKTRVQREVEYMRALRHPHIVKLYEVISTPTDIIIVLEFAGGELFNYIVANGRMLADKARRFFQQIISGVAYSHSLKIVHRDLKPENILLDDDLNVKIADFGLSNDINDGQFMATSCGSPNYAAPEVIRAERYTGPEIDVWSCGVILYVMLCGRLPFEDDDVQQLFNKISQGSYHMPSYVPQDARALINAMLAVDPVKRITIPDIINHPFFKVSLPRYLTPLPPPPGPVLGTLAALVTPPKVLDFEIIEGLGRIEEDIIKELAERMTGVEIPEIWECLRRDDGVQGNAVKVAYLLLRDKRRLGRDMAEFEEQERDAQLAAQDPINALSPSAISPGMTNLSHEMNPFFEDFETSEDEDDYNDDGGLDFTPPLTAAELAADNFAVLNSSLPQDQQTYRHQTEPPLPDQLPEPHHLASFKHRYRPRDVVRHQHRTKWHFGIRSRSPPMEVMLEIYKTLKTLGMEWKEKRSLGGLGGVHPLNGNGNAKGKSRGIERVYANDGGHAVDLKAASGVYFVETRARVQDLVVLMNLQLYMVDSVNYLVDFHHKKSYKASIDPAAGKFDMAISNVHPGMDTNWGPPKEEDVVSPFVFMDVACRLILELAG